MRFDSLVRFARRASIAGIIAIATVAPIQRAQAAADGKGVAKCHAAVTKGGAKFLAKKLTGLAKCSDGVFKCIQTVDETGDAGAKRTACITKARGGCLKSLATITAARQAYADAVAKSCAALEPAQVTGADGLGFAADDCADCDTPVSSVPTLAACVAQEHNCVASRIFQFDVPRVLEMTTFAPPAAVTVPAADLASIACLEDQGGTGADVGDPAVGKSIVKCQKAIEKVGAKLGAGRLKNLEKCVDGLFACAVTKTGDDLAKCRDKARAGCLKGFATNVEHDASLTSGLDKSCGDATLFTTFQAAGGGNLQALVPDGCAALTTLADFKACLVTHWQTLTDDLVRCQAPRAESLLGEVNCELGSCGAAPTATPTPGPTPTSTPGGSGISQIIGSTGDGAGHGLSHPEGITVRPDGSVVYVTGCVSDNAFKIANGVITQIISASGDGQGHTLDCPFGIQADDNGNVYVGGAFSHNVFKIAANGTVTQIMDATGDGQGHAIFSPEIALGPNGDLFVAGGNNVFRIASNGGITLIMDATGDGQGAGHNFAVAQGIAVDAAGAVYVTGDTSRNAFKIVLGTPNTITRIIDSTGDGTHALIEPTALALDGLGNVYVTDYGDPFADHGGQTFKIASNGTVTLLTGFFADHPFAVAGDAAGNAYVTGADSSDAYKIPPVGTPVKIINSLGDKQGHFLESAEGVAIDAAGNVYVTGVDSGNAFKILAAP